jgi:hypothetical protein
MYLQQGKLNVELMGRGYAWLDTGTHDSLLEAGQFIATLQQRQGLKVACPEEIAYRQAGLMPLSWRSWPGAVKNGYGQYLLQVLKEKVRYEVHALAIPDVFLIEPKVFGDARGFSGKLSPGSLQPGHGHELRVHSGQPQPQQQGRAAWAALPAAAPCPGQAGACDLRCGV